MYTACDAYFAVLVWLLYVSWSRKALVADFDQYIYMRTFDIIFVDISTPCNQPCKYSREFKGLGFGWIESAPSDILDESHQVSDIISPSDNKTL